MSHCPRVRSSLTLLPVLGHLWKTFCGQNILAPNSDFSPENVDERGYVPVEWWIMSKTQAENPVPKEGEGLTKLDFVFFALLGTYITLLSPLSTHSRWCVLFDPVM